MRETKIIKNITRNQQGITLVALVITIIVLLILAGVSISVLFGENGIISKAKRAENDYNNAATEENAILEEYLRHIENATGTAKYSGGQYNVEKGINAPRLMPGMTAVYWEGTPGNYAYYELSSSDPEEKWAKWYDYNTTANESKWANAVTKDSKGNITGYWVWIPRYEYKITTETKTIEINFIKNKEASTTSGYKLHPAFGTDINNGGWRSELEGIWIAKFAAGFQASTINNTGQVTNAQDQIIYSNLTYTSRAYDTNALDQDLTTANYQNTKLAYPVFKPQTYAYNVIGIGDIYSISKAIASATSFYGLSSSITDSHQMKNSEWGAVAYLTHSAYGRNKTEPNINNLNINNTEKTIHAVTGFAGAGKTTAAETSMANVNAYDTATGVLGSSTGNIYGIYDLNGCVTECTAGYITNGHASLEIYGKSMTEYNSSTDYRTTSTEYITIYPYNSSNDTSASNWTYFNTNYASTRYGDAILETSTAGTGSTSWNNDRSLYAYDHAPFFARGDAYHRSSASGLFAFDYSMGDPYYYIGFRSVLCVK